MSNRRASRTVLAVLAATAGLTFGATGLASASSSDTPELAPAIASPVQPVDPAPAEPDPCVMPELEPGMVQADVCPPDPRVTMPHDVIDPGPVVADPAPEPVVRDHRGPDAAPGGGVTVESDPIVRDHRDNPPVVRDHRQAR